MSFATKQRASQQTMATKAQLATRALLSRCATNTDWLARDLASDRPTMQVKASVWTHDQSTPITWNATTPPDAYTVLLLLDDACLSLHSDAHALEERPCDAGAYYVSRPGETVSVHCQGPCRALHLSVPVQLFWCGDDTVPGCFSLRPAHDALLLQLGRTLLEMHNTDGETQLADQVMDLFTGHLRRLRSRTAPHAIACRKTSLPHWRLQRVDRHVQAHLSDHITLNDMAAAAGLSPMHFASRFRATTGYRPHHYLLLCRMEHAKKLMSSAPRSILDVALEVGFHTQSHFTTVFKRLTGKTPRQWRGETMPSQPM